MHDWVVIKAVELMAKNQFFLLRINGECPLTVRNKERKDESVLLRETGRQPGSSRHRQPAVRRDEVGHRSALQLICDTDVVRTEAPNRRRRTVKGLCVSLALCINLAKTNISGITYPFISPA